MITHADKDSFWLQKRAFTREILGERTLVREATPDLSEDRSRFDLMLYRGKLGIRGPKKSSDAWDFDFNENFSVEYLQPDLRVFIEEFQEELPRLATYFEAAQIRFRSDGKKNYGAWIDTQRTDLERFAASPDCTALADKIFLELGQRGDLVARRPHVWLPSFSKFNDELHLVSYISSFSQPGPEANRAMIACGMELLEKTESASWLELGAGYGNLTAAFTTLLGAPKWVLEKESRDSALLELNENFFAGAELRTQSVEQIHFPEKVDLLLADPPRSGFSEFFAKDLIRAERILLFSCDLRGLLKDAEALRAHYQIQKWSLLDNFPGTPYAEAISLWERSS